MEMESSDSTVYRQKKKERLPKFPFDNIAISMSGGGFRATAFHLGLITYLSSVEWKGISLLERTRILSTVSAGTFTGVKYISSLKKGGNIVDCYKSLHKFMADCDLVSEALQYLSDDKYWKEGKQRTLINAFAAIYNREFESEKFGILWDQTHPIHLKEISFNATEFNFSLPFRFKKSELTRKGHEYIGNRKIHIPVEIAKEIRLSDIIAATSCFPFGFEPLNFPDDFIHEECKHLSDHSQLPHKVFDGDKIVYPIGLMDGAIDDNQGVDAVVVAEECMKNYPEELKKYCSPDDKAVDLYIISDVSPPDMDSYNHSGVDNIPLVGKWTFDSLRTYGIFSAIIGMASIVLAFLIDTKFFIIALSVFGTIEILMALVLLIFSMGITGLTRKFGVPDFVVNRLLHFDRLKFSTLYNMFINRRNSAMKLITDVFLKQIKWFSFERVYGDPAWRTRLVQNATRKLTYSEVEKRKIKYPNLSKTLAEPGEKIMNTTTRAISMGTTLWFTNEELEGEKNLLNTIIATGQYTICFNLLEYIERHLKNKHYEQDYEKYPEETKKNIELLQQELLKDWEKFKINPYWQVEEWNKITKEDDRDPGLRTNSFRTQET